jgi:hypothetical protein
LGWGDLFESTLSPVYVITPATAKATAPRRLMSGLILFTASNSFILEFSGAAGGAPGLLLPFAAQSIIGAVVTAIFGGKGKGRLMWHNYPLIRMFRQFEHANRSGGSHKQDTALGGYIGQPLL